MSCKREGSNPTGCHRSRVPLLGLTPPGFARYLQGSAGQEGGREGEGSWLNPLACSARLLACILYATVG